MATSLAEWENLEEELEAQEAILSDREQKMSSRKKGRGRYNPAQLASWNTVASLSGTVLAEGALWRIVAMCCSVSAVVALLIVFLPGVHRLNDAEGLNRVNLVVRVLLAFILALYMTASVGRWWSSMETVSDFFESIKQLQLDLCAMNAPIERLSTVRRYALVSATLLKHEVHTMWVKDKAEVEKRWYSVAQECRQRGWLTVEEQRWLSGAHPEHRSELVWCWVGSVLAMQITDLNKAAAPPMASRLTKLAGSCISALQCTKAAVAYQIPLTYVHTVASLVHVNNIVLAVTSGIAIGVSSQAAHRYDNALEHGREIDDRREGLAQSVQTIVMRVFYMVISPLVFQAFLHIGSCMNDPFSEKLSHGAPLGEFIDDLEESLVEIEVLAARKVTVPPPRSRAIKRESKDAAPGLSRS